MERVRSLVIWFALPILIFIHVGAGFSADLDDFVVLLQDTIFIDNFNRPGPNLGPIWTADPEYQIISNELSNIDSVVALDDLAIFNPRINPIGLSFRWGIAADTLGMQRTGLALMMDDASTTANGYFLFRNYSLNWYSLWAIVNGVVTASIASSPQSELPFFVPGDEFQVAISSDGDGHHFDIFLNNQFDVRLTDPDKVLGNADTLYSGVVLDGGFNNNVDDFTFWKFSGDSTPPSVVGDLAFDSSTPNSITLTWTAPGDDDTLGTASRYDVRYSQSQISELNFDNASRAMSEPVPSPFGTIETFTITGLEPDSRYYFAMKSDDGFPQRNISDISNTDSGWTQDDIPPMEIDDLVVNRVNSHTVVLQWTATGDNDSLGMADRYDVRYSTTPITESNFAFANEAIGEPSPLLSGEIELFTVGGMYPDSLYYFAVKVYDEANNSSPISNVVSAKLASYPAILDDFERVLLGPDWVADSNFVIISGELSNKSLVESWDFVALYMPASNAEAMSFRWGVNADEFGIGEGGMALMMNAASTDASGYLLFRSRINNYYALWTIIDGSPDALVNTSPVSSLPAPQAGDVFQVVVSSDLHGHHFDCYYNGQYDTRVSDPDKVQGNTGEWYSGVMLHGNRNNNIDDYYAMGPGTNVAPGTFSLLSPANGSIVETGTPILDWEDSIDPNLSDSVLYTLYYGLSATFAPESTIVVDDLSESQYTIPPMNLIALLRDLQRVAGNGMPSKGMNHRQTGKMVVGESTPSKAAEGEGDVSLSALPDDVVIYWKVKAVDTGDLETWSLQEDWSFTVSIPEPPLPFSLLSPGDGDTVTTRTPTLSWEAATDPDPGDVVTYTLYIADNPEFNPQVIFPDIEETSYTTPTLQDETWYYWKVEAVDSKELITESNETFSFFVYTSLGVGDGGVMPELPKVFALDQNYPNPFNPSTSIGFDIPVDVVKEEGDRVLLQVYNLRGQLVRTLVDEVKTAGSYVVHWDGTNDQGEMAGSGIFLYRIQAGNFNATKKMVILK